MELKDFTYTCNARGYMIQYKGQNIGGAGISKDALSPRGRAAKKQISDYHQLIKLEIDALIRGTGQPRFLEAIKNIEERTNHER